MALITGTSRELLQTFIGLKSYKPNQGFWARYGTLAVLLVVVIAGAYAAYTQLFAGMASIPRYLSAGAVVAVFGWLSYRLIHWPRFADFLITTEMEMNKVSWPSASEVKTSTIVVLVFSVLMGFFLFGVDWTWQHVLYYIRILEFRSGALGDSGN